MPTVHVVGAGVAGLAAAVRLARDGVRVCLYEAAGQAGGRCRSYFDTALGRRIDNGNHLLLAGNGSAMAYLDETGAAGSLTGPQEPAFPFVDLSTGARWCVRPNAGPMPWWIWSDTRRVPGSRATDYLRALGLARAAPEATVREALASTGQAYAAFWEPLAVAVLNTEAEAGAANLLWPVMKEIFAKGGAAARPLIARDGLSESFVTPALGTLRDLGAQVAFNRRLKRLEIDAGRVRALDFGAAPVPLDAGDRIVLAVPPGAATELVPGLTAPDEFRPIVNGHFDLGRPPPMPGGSPVLGLIGGVAQWLFARDTIVSVTVSAASGLVEEPADRIAAALWRDIDAALGLGGAEAPRHRIVKERRATFAQTPAQVRRRPPAESAVGNLLLAGDWTDTGLPATIEGAIRSGHRAAAMVVKSVDFAHESRISV